MVRTTVTDLDRPTPRPQLCRSPCDGDKVRRQLLAIGSDGKFRRRRSDDKVLTASSAGVRNNRGEGTNLTSVRVVDKFRDGPDNDDWNGQINMDSVAVTEAFRDASGQPRRGCSDRHDGLV